MRKSLILNSINHTLKLNKNKYESEMQVRPDDIDMFRHVHSSRYIDYVLAARYDQMGRCYGMPMEEFLQNGFGWVIVSTHMEFKRPLKLGDYFVVSTQLVHFEKHTAKVDFEILKKEGMKLCCTGHFDYTMIDMATGRAAALPDWIIERYSLPE
ncbi:MAG: acyl-CoA thioesterase [Bacteroidetes bacterium]|nr:MAG: acyl-CoA thioesterase [Bacteroidota bacterium]